MRTIFALGHQVQLVCEERKGAVLEYGDCVPQQKVVPDAKNDLQRQALLGLERCGA